jgi:hypothetical protein
MATRLEIGLWDLWDLWKLCDLCTPCDPCKPLRLVLTPLRFLDGQSLGGSQAPTEMTPFMGIESFFLPAELDNQLGELGNPGFGTGNGASGNGGNFGGAMQDGHGALGQGDVWW